MGLKRSPRLRNAIVARRQRNISLPKAQPQQLVHVLVVFDMGQGTRTHIRQIRTRDGGFLDRLIGCM